MNSRRFTARCLPCFGPRATTARLQVETKSLAARGTITRTSRYLARHDMENAAFASSMPRSSLVLKNSESLVLQTENAPHLQRSPLVPPNSEPGSKELRRVVGSWTEPDDRARSVRCEQPYEPTRAGVQ